jgi:hypothetical protein
VRGLAGRRGCSQPNASERPPQSRTRPANAHAEIDRHVRWAPARDALWQLLQPLLSPATRVAVLGAGNGDDVPLDRIAGRARDVSLVDLDAPAARGASHAASGVVSKSSSTTSPMVPRTES